MVNEDPVFYVGDQQRSWQRPNFQSHSADDKATLRPTRWNAVTSVVNRGLTTPFSKYFIRAAIGRA
jgi:hypothetical protein